MAAGDESPWLACKGLAEHKLRPFGENPTIRRLKVQGESACIVFPSKDQVRSAWWDVAVVIRYPHPVEIGGDRYGLLEMYADKDYALDILKTLRFFGPKEGNALVSLSVAPRNANQAGTAASKVGVPVSLTLKLTNHSQQVLHFALTDPVFAYRFTVKNKWGDPIAGGDQFRETRKKPLARNIPITLNPNESCQDTIPISDLFFDVERPGKYTVQVERDLPPEFGNGIILSNTIQLQVIE